MKASIAAFFDQVWHRQFDLRQAFAGRIPVASPLYI
jgi:hypothetical protein